MVAAAGTAVIGVLVASYSQEAAGANPTQAVAAVSLVGSLLAFIISGALIVSRQPGNVVGWLLMIPGLALPASTLATNWLGSMPPPEQVTAPMWVVLWALSWSWILLIFPIFHMLLTFPDGRLLSPRWRWAVALELAMIAVFLGFAAFRLDLNLLVNDAPVWTVPNPIGFLPNDLFDAALGTIWGVGLLAMTIVSAAAVVVRFRRGSTVERQQLKWPVLAVVLFGAVYGGALLYPGLVGNGSILFGVSLAGIPISVAIAVLRYRLYAIDHIISRTVSWAMITAVLVAVFVGGVLGLQAVLTGGHAGAHARGRRVHARGVRAVPAHPPSRPARRRPSLRSSALRCRAHRDELLGSAPRGGRDRLDRGRPPDDHRPLGAAVGPGPVAAGRARPPGIGLVTVTGRRTTTMPS